MAINCWLLLYLLNVCNVYARLSAHIGNSISMNETECYLIWWLFIQIIRIFQCCCRCFRIFRAALLLIILEMAHAVLS